MYCHVLKMTQITNTPTRFIDITHYLKPDQLIYPNPNQSNHNRVKLNRSQFSRRRRSIEAPCKVAEIEEVMEAVRSSTGSWDGKLRARPR
uniref:Uncharacterized protein n=1 Tax=Daucus carota subsp. sativus TaxID=79200 RepID=A0A175YEW0_DAUCS